MVVASPKPKHICDISLVESLSSNGTIVIAGGGGGVPVVRNSQGLRSGVEAVIDKDLTTAHMANVLGFKDIMILTAVSQVAINFGKPEQQELGHITVSEAKRYFEEGQFPAGSMGPKIEAMIRDAHSANGKPDAYELIVKIAAFVDHPVIELSETQYLHPLEDQKGRIFVVLDGYAPRAYVAEGVEQWRPLIADEPAEPEL